MSGIAEVAKETLILEQYLKGFNPGEKVLYRQIEAETGIVMDDKGKACLRTAFKRARLQYTQLRTPERGMGYILASPGNTVGIIVENLTKVDRGIKKTHNVTVALKERFYNQLTDSDKKAADFVHRETGAMLAFARLLTKGVFAKDKPKIINI
jgi:hypothetical protein